MGQTAQIVLTPGPLPGKRLTFPMACNIAANANETTITINVAAGAPLVTQNVIISGNLSNNVQVGPAITLTISSSDLTCPRSDVQDTIRQVAWQPAGSCLAMVDRLQQAR